MKFPSTLLLFLFLISVISSAPIENTSEEPSKKPPPSHEYDLSQFSEVYDQRQNGSENYRINLDGVVLVLSPPGGLFQAASLLDPALFEGEYPDLEELLLKPDNLVPPKPETTKAPVVTSTTPVPVVKTRNNLGEIQSSEDNPKWKFRLPGLIKPFVKHHPSYY